jgi:HEAT repeat protein
MDGSKGLFKLWQSQSFSTRLITGALGGAGLLGAVWSLADSAVGSARPVPHQSIRVASTPVRFQDITRMLADQDPAVRLEAIKYLEVLNRPADELISVLATRFDDPDSVVRIQAVYAAIRLGMPARQGIPVARRLLIPNHPRVCCLAAQVLGLAGPTASDNLPQLRACLSAKQTWVSLHAARAAVRINVHEADAISVLLRSWDASEPGEVRDFTAAALQEVAGKLAAELKDESVEVRRAAAISLEQFRSCGTAAVPALVNGFADADPLVRAHAARAAFRAGVSADHVTRAVIGLLTPDQPEVLHLATSVLVEIGPEAQDALPALHECCKTPAMSIRLYAADAALRIDSQDPLALEQLQAALESPRADIRYFAVNSLGPAILENDLAALALLDATADPKPQVAVAAALQLSRMQDLSLIQMPWNGGAEPASQELTEDDEATLIAALSAESAALRRDAAWRLALKGPIANAALLALEERLGDSDSGVQLAAAHGVWTISRNGERVLPVLDELLTSEQPEIRSGAAFALGQMGSAAVRTVPELDRLMRHSQSFEQLLMAATLVRINPNDDAAFSLLLARMHSPNADVRYLATVALGAMPLSRQPTTEEALAAVIQDGNSRVRYAAYESMSQLLVRRAAWLALQGGGPQESLVER